MKPFPRTAAGKEALHAFAAACILRDDGHAIASASGLSAEQVDLIHEAVESDWIQNYGDTDGQGERSFALAVADAILKAVGDQERTETETRSQKPTTE